MLLAASKTKNVQAKIRYPANTNDDHLLFKNLRVSPLLFSSVLSSFLSFFFNRNIDSIVDIINPINNVTKIVYI